MTVRDISARELIEYYDCPAHLVKEAQEYVRDGKDPAEVVEALIEADNA